MGKQKASDIDFVMIWVDGNDPAWRAEKAKYDSSGAGFGDHEIRFRDWENLQYFFRGVEEYAPWVRKIHFVTWGHLPKWMNVNHPKLHIVNHKDFIPEKYLPTFSSHTIELNLHRIPGLAEQFVYFNDDIFLTAPVTREDFFRKGLPCDIYGESIVNMMHDTMGSYLLTVLEIINRNFSKYHQLGLNWRKWLSPGNGTRQVMKTLPFLFWPYFTNFYYQHLNNSYLKATYEQVWEKEEEILDRTCRDRFRMKGNVNQNLMKYWQLVTGNFMPKKGGKGHAFFVKDDNFQEVCEAIIRQKYQIICANDHEDLSEFPEKARIIRECFEQILPNRSSYEIEQKEEE